MSALDALVSRIPELAEKHSREAVLDALLLIASGAGLGPDEIPAVLRARLPAAKVDQLPPALLEAILGAFEQASAGARSARQHQACSRLGVPPSNTITPRSERPAAPWTMLLGR
jgi:hypothetical protein